MLPTKEYRGLPELEEARKDPLPNGWKEHGPTNPEFSFQILRGDISLLQPVVKYMP